MADEGRKIQHRACARIGFLGNPSDGYFGNTLAIAISNFGATVTLEPSETLMIRPHPLHDPWQFASLQQLVSFGSAYFHFLHEWIYGGMSGDSSHGRVVACQGCICYAAIGHCGQLVEADSGL